MNRNRQLGLSLIELMVSIVVGLLIAGGMFQVYVNSATSSYSLLQSSKLNQELSSLMLVMGNDIRRAGYWGDPDDDNQHTNPFSRVDNTALTVIDNLSSNTAVAPNSAAGGECILYAFDADEDGVLDNEDIFGFRLNNDVVQMREQGDATQPANDDCTRGTWLDVTSNTQFRVTGLNFSLSRSQCVNADEPNRIDDDNDGTLDNESDCYATPPDTAFPDFPEKGVFTVETRQLRITIAGELVQDPSVRATIEQDVRVRNDMVRLIEK